MHHFDLVRTFSEFVEAEGQEENWELYLSDTPGQLSWQQLQDQKLLVVLGEAGIGKTIELSLQANRLRARGQHAFFVALNQLSDSESWDLALGAQSEAYSQWLSESSVATFFLDAVDESRLRSHADFERALAVVQMRLRGNMHRNRIVISSRPSDWSADKVRTAVDVRLEQPLSVANRKSTPSVDAGTDNPLSASLLLEPDTTANSALLVVKLDPLSAAEAQRLALFYGLKNEIRFWQAIDDGGYEFMALRPLDLNWLVKLWNEEERLGTFRELLESSVRHQLSDFNPEYISAGVLPSAQKLLDGAQKLSAASELSVRPYVSVRPDRKDMPGELSPYSVLEDWEPAEIDRLLATAIFDEASYGRVRFHHRTTRAYLAATWADTQLKSGTPLHLITGLFTSSPFGDDVLVPNRRWMLCWLAAINVHVRTWLAQYYPEMFVFDGDPQSWDAPTADMAFIAVLNKLDDGAVHKWHNSKSEYRRLGLGVSSRLIATRLSDINLHRRAQSLLFFTAKYGRVTESAEVVFQLALNLGIASPVRAYALDVLETVGTLAQKETITDALVRGLFSSNELIASALMCANLQSINKHQLAKIFLSTESERNFGSGTMTQAITREVLPKASLKDALLLLGGVLEALPRPARGQIFRKYPESDQPDLAWLLDVLPNCFERVLQIAPHSFSASSVDCLSAAERLEALRDTGFIERDEFSRLQVVLTKHKELRWQIALKIAESEDISHSVSRLSWGTHCLVAFDQNDIEMLVDKANELASNDHIRSIWFSVAMDVAYRSLRGPARRKAFEALCNGSPDAIARRSAIEERRRLRLGGITAQRVWRKEESVRKQASAWTHQQNVKDLMARIEAIRNGSDFSALRQMLQFSHDRSEQKTLSRVDYGVLEAKFGVQMSLAVRKGLMALEAVTEPPDTADYLDGRIPWKVLMCLASLNVELADAHAIEAMTRRDVERAAMFATWESREDLAWFMPMAEVHLNVVADALSKWIKRDLEDPKTYAKLRGALHLALQTEGRVRRKLLEPLTGGIDDKYLSKLIVESVDLIQALRDEEIVSRQELIAVCKSNLDKVIAETSDLAETFWMRTWLEEEPATALAWLQSNLEKSPAKAHDYVKAFAKLSADFKWVSTPISDVEVDVLSGMYELFSLYMPVNSFASLDDEQDLFGASIERVRDAIPAVLTLVPTSASRAALLTILNGERDANARAYLRSQLQEQSEVAAAEVEFRPESLCATTQPFTMEPRTEGQLFVQTMSRLKEIKLGTEKGPFSDRGLFNPKTHEKALQNWLAARLYEQPNRRFSVAREEAVDDDKMPDIQTAIPGGKVCVEIKPVGAKHSYSAASLTMTLEQQIGHQYLRGLNSRHGVLVLFRLDTKRWRIPGESRLRSFEQLVEYLQTKASEIKLRSSNVDALEVIGIDCVSPKHVRLGNA